MNTDSLLDFQGAGLQNELMEKGGRTMAQGLVRRIVVEQHPCHSRPIKVSGSELSINWPEQGQDCARKVVHQVTRSFIS